MRKQSGLELNRAIKRSLLGKYSLYAFQIFSMVLLARLFAPGDFGYVAIVQVFITLMVLISSTSIVPAMVYLDDVSVSQRNGLMSLSLLLGLLLATLSFFAFPLVCFWIGMKDMPYAALFIAVTVFFVCLTTSPLASLQRGSKFILIARAEIYAETVSLLMCLVLFYFSYGFYALLFKVCSPFVFRFIFYYQMSAQTEVGRPALGRDLVVFKTIVSFVKFQFLFNLVNFFSRNLDTIIVAKFFGLNVTAFYDKSYQVMRYPLQLFTFAITPALQPTLTKHKADVSFVASEFLRVLQPLAYLGLFVSMVFYNGSGALVYLLFGPGWESVNPILTVFSVSIPLQMVLSATGAIYQSFGQSRLQFYCGLFSVISTFIAISVGAYVENILLLCQLIVCSFVINYLFCFFVMYRFIFQVKPSYVFYKVCFLIMLPFVMYSFEPIFPLPEPDYLSSTLMLVQASLLSLAICAVVFAGQYGFDLMHRKSDKEVI
ncbi:oligosaccharide flippase family protein [Rheinheimera sp. 1928-s]|uniref:oligosaccharide flippase family protein n=1 Tax=Rheinheimera sp. 1928-s TaxID=3033803 RepID=UPI0026100072|nr:oligosaccharide flippase family protein [Rheinheimera sp. 1928-s]MDF3125678.1 oligosaccharide flippase family protein [Rheinheimera sp. 1928-s]